MLPNSPRFSNGALRFYCLCARTATRTGVKISRKFHDLTQEAEFGVINTSVISKSETARKELFFCLSRDFSTKRANEARAIILRALRYAAWFHMHHLIQHFQARQFCPHTLYLVLCVSYDCHDKQRLFPQPGSVPGQLEWDLWQTMLQSNRFFSEFFGSPLSV